MRKMCGVLSQKGTGFRGGFLILIQEPVSLTRAVEVNPMNAILKLDHIRRFCSLALFQNTIRYAVLAISVIFVVLIRYINNYMLKQRSREWRQVTWRQDGPGVAQSRIPA
jgi:hypothetical protein